VAVWLGLLAVVWCAVFIKCIVIHYFADKVGLATTSCVDGSFIAVLLRLAEYSIGNYFASFTALVKKPPATCSTIHCACILCDKIDRWTGARGSTVCCHNTQPG
jgi:hypothetical protein